MSAAGFRVARVAALRGRVLLDADEQPGAPAVVVLGHEVARRTREIGIRVALGALGGSLSLGQIALLLGYALLLLAVCLLACTVPTRRALRVEPTHALRAGA